MISRRKFALACAALGLALVAQPGSGRAQQAGLRFSQWLPVGHFTQKDLLHIYFKDVEKATEGRVKIEPTAKALGAPPRQYQLLVDAIADVAYVVHGYTPGVFPLSEMAELPFLTRSTEANSAAYWRVFEKHFKPAGMHKDVHTLTVFVHPAGHIYNNRREIKAISDLEGLKIRSPTSLVSDALKMMGAVPVSAPVTDLREGLAKGIFDGTTFTDEAIYNFNISKFVKHATHIPGGLYTTSFAMAMNADKWKQISAKDQAAVMKLSGETLAKRVGKAWDAQENAAPAKLKADGVTYTTFEGKALNDLKAKIGVFETQWLEKAKAAGVDGAAALKMFRDEVARYKS